MISSKNLAASARSASLGILCRYSLRRLATSVDVFNPCLASAACPDILLTYLSVLLRMLESSKSTTAIRSPSAMMLVVMSMLTRRFSSDDLPASSVTADTVSKTRCMRSWDSPEPSNTCRISSTLSLPICPRNAESSKYPFRFARSMMALAISRRTCTSSISRIDFATSSTIARSAALVVIPASTSFCSARSI